MSPEYAAAFRKFQFDLLAVDDIRIPRYMAFRKSENVKLNVFGDASIYAYAAVTHLRIRIGNRIDNALLCSKTRVAPIKLVTLARLELCASLLVAQLIHRVSNDVGVKKENCFAYSDSQIVLAWLAKHS